MPWVSISRFNQLSFAILTNGMKTSCVAHPENEPLIIVRRWQVQACDGDFCAAELLSFFEQKHDILTLKTPLPFTEKQLEDGILNSYGRKAIRRSLARLEKIGFIKVEKDPFRANCHLFTFCDSALNGWIKANFKRN